MSKIFALSVGLIVYADNVRWEHSYTDGVGIMRAIAGSLLAFSCVRGFAWLIKHT